MTVLRRGRRNIETKIGIIPSSSAAMMARASGGLAPMSYGSAVVRSKYDSSSSSGGEPLARPGGNWTMDRAMRTGYERSVWYYRAIEAKAQNAANRHIHSYKPDGTWSDTNLTELLNGPTPNPIETGKSLRRRISLQLDTSPRGVFIELTRSKSGQLARVDLLPPGRTMAIPGDPGGGVDHFELSPLHAKRGEVIPLDPDDVVWIANRHPDNPWRSMTALETLGLTVEIDYFARLYARSFMLNDGRPGGIINIKGDVSDDEADRIERKFGGGPEDSGRNVVLNQDDIQYEEVGRAGIEAGYGSTRLAARDEIFLATGVPLSIAGDASGRTFSNADAEAEQFWLITEMPWMGLMLDPWQAFAPSGELFAHDVSDVAVLERHKAEKDARLLVLFQAGVITWDEWRAATGRSTWDQPWTRCIYLPGNYWLPAKPEDAQVLSDLQKQHTTTPVPPVLGPDGQPVPVGPDGQPVLPAPGSVPPGGLLPPLTGPPLDGHGNTSLNPLGNNHPALVSQRFGENVPAPKALPAGEPSSEHLQGASRRRVPVPARAARR